MKKSRYDNEYLLDYIRKMHNAFQFRFDWKYKSKYDPILRDGIICEPQPFPAQYKHLRGEIGNCYNNATMAAFENPTLIYVEGIALQSDELYVPMEHAWCIDENRRVIDVTWPKTGTVYIGVPIDTGALARIVDERKCGGVFFVDAPTRKYNPFKDGLAEGAIIPKHKFGQ